MNNRHLVSRPPPVQRDRDPHGRTIPSEQPEWIFVFGSNEAGVHGAGAAREAYSSYGAVWGQGFGRHGRSYAIPTKDANLTTISLPGISSYVQVFLAYARLHPELRFFVTRIGCGLAGYRDADIGPMFAGAPDNVDLPVGWG